MHPKPSLVSASLWIGLLACACAREPTPTPTPSATLSSSAPPPAGARVSLSLHRASASRTDDGVLIVCDATLENRTGAPLDVVTNFGSAFDGLSIVLTEGRGDEILRRPYIYHQSPYAEDRRIPLPPGTTHHTLAFPLDALPHDSLRVRLEGGLPGTDYDRGLVSNELRVAIAPRAPRER